MTSKEKRLERIEHLEGKLSELYQCELIGEIKWFVRAGGTVFHIESLGEEYNALVLEYADTMDAARKNTVGEDGDLFYMDELDESEMLEAMIREIEG